jgi:Uma2 family endonuclease
MSSAPAAVYTPEDLLTMPDGDRYELVDGQLKELSMGWEASWVSTSITAPLYAYCRANDLGFVAGPEAGYQCFPGRPNLVRKPDVSFVRKGRFPDNRFPSGHARLAPDLAVEVISPTDLSEETMEKVRDYRSAGVPLLWLVYPRARLALVCRADGSAVFLTEDQDLSGEDVVPGFTCRLRDVLPPVPPG